ncbi:malonyl-ACP O-methyltransferase BioC [Pseudoteredinibacter isoporae]|uniref:malonyl-ACP O-methyltransferase BioC n=1 Tax=Pseudoteredinibacter isoporae TaxID=570281 RepID=UPI0031058B29
MNILASKVLENERPQRITLERVSYPANCDDAEHFVLIHGWGLGNDIWHQILPQLTHVHVHCVSLPGFDQSSAADYALDDLLAAIEDALPATCHLLGYSLGGLLAQRLLNSDKVATVTCLAAGPQFVANSDWAHGMAADTFIEFCAFFERAPEACLRRFMGLQSQGDGQQKKCLVRSLGLMKNNGLDTDYFERPQYKSAWKRALTLLGEIDNQSILIENINKPVHFVFAEQDALVPVASADAVRALSLDNVQVSTIPGAHCVPFYLGQTEHAALLLEASQHDNQNRYRLDKTRVARSFSRAASNYDSVAGLQRQVCEQLFETLSTIGFQGKTVVDLGSGTGYFSQLLKQNSNLGQPESLLNLDLAEGMLRYSREQVHNILPASRWIAADAERLPLANCSVECLFSSLAIQWCQQEDQLFREIYRVLKPGAKAHIATLGPDSLWQLREAWAQVDNKVHVNRFTPWSDLKRSIQQAGLQANFHKADIVLGFDTFKQLRFELKTLGAQNMNSGQVNGLSGRHRLQKLLSAYELFRQPCSEGGQLPLSYEVYYLTLEKPET